jgi:hypothetical protein
MQRTSKISETLCLAGMFLHRCVRFLVYMTCARIAVYVIYTEDCLLTTSNFRFLHVLCSTNCCIKHLENDMFSAELTVPTFLLHI